MFRILIVFSLFLYSCNNIGAGSNGAWKIKGFPFTNKEVTASVNSLYEKYPEYLIPKKWEEESGYWKNDGYDKSRILFFYFKSAPEEMYFVFLVAPGFVDHPEYARLAVISVYSEKTGWKVIKEQSDKDKVRIQQRFENEIISKLEKSMGTKTFDVITYP